MDYECRNCNGYGYHVFLAPGDALGLDLECGICDGTGIELPPLIQSPEPDWDLGGEG